MGFLISPWFKFFVVPLLIIGLIGGVIFGVKNMFHNYLEGVRLEVHKEYEVRDLKQAVKDAEADKVFAEEQARKSDEHAEELRQSLTTALHRVQVSSRVIHEQVASGELPNGKLSPTIEASINQVEILENERKSK